MAKTRTKSGREPEPEVRVRLSGPAALVAAVPHLVGFHPAESVVVLGLRPPRRRVELTARQDLPPAEDEAAVAGELSEFLGRSEVTEAVVVVYTDTDPAAAAAAAPRSAFVAELRSRLRDHEVSTRDALLVHRGRWRSYWCSDPGCCPADGTLVPASDAPESAEIAAAMAIAGRAVLSDRAALERSVDPVSSVAAEAMRQALARAEATWSSRLCDHGLHEARCETLHLIRRLLAGWDQGECTLDDDQAALVIVGVEDLLVRDRAMLLAEGGRRASAIPLWSELTRRSIPPYGAAPATVLAWTAYADGDGALARIAAERALRTEPGYTGAWLVVDGLDAGVPPATMRRSLTASRRDVERAWRASARRARASPTGVQDVWGGERH